MRKYLLHVLIISFVFFVPTIIHSAEEEKDRLLVVPLKAKKGIDQDEASLLTDILSVEIIRSNLFTVLNRDDMKAILDEKEFELAMGCGEDNICLLENVAKLAVNKVIAGSIGLLGKKYIVSIKLINKDGQTERMLKESCSCPIEDLEKTIETISYRFLKNLGGEEVSAPESVVSREEPSYKTYSDGSKYVGGLVDGRRSGQGTFTTPDGKKYVGELKNGKMHGQGTFTWPDGNKYVGEWKDGKKHGQGTLIWPDGKYVGEFKDDKYHGQGTCTSPNGKYVGEWRNDEMHGQGTVTLPDGSKYVGEFKDNNMHGQGTFTFPDGAKYVGEFKNGLATGGWLYLADGSKEWTLMDSQGNWVYQPERGKKAPATEGSHITLRSSYKTLYVYQVQSMSNVYISEKSHKGFYGHSTISHNYEKRSINGDGVVIDHATGLMWYQSGSEEEMSLGRAKWWAGHSSKGYAGYHDWRLPTLEEATTLLEFDKNNSDLYIDPVFSGKQVSIWTGDRHPSEAAWLVCLSHGFVDWYDVTSYGSCVRPVRSVR